MYLKEETRAFIQHPAGFRYFPDAIRPRQEQDLLKFIDGLEFQPYVMRGQPSRRGIVRFGYDYGPVGGSHHIVAPLSSELILLRDIAARTAGLAGKEFVASVVTRYSPGATIGWHSDMTMFGPVVFGISLQGACVMKLRPKSEPRSVLKIELAPRSLYVMEGELRWNWEHSIPPVKELRYSITYRTVKT